jgi:hypothetical protein
LKGRRLNPNLITAKTKVKTKAKATAKTTAKTVGLASRMDSVCWLGGLPADHP